MFDPLILNEFLLVGIFLLGTIAFAFSTVGGGGGMLLMIPVMSWFFGAQSTAPILNLGGFLGRPSRIILFWKNINWRIVLYYAPLAVIGAVLSAFLFSKVKLYWVQLFVALFLIASFVNYIWKREKPSFKTKFWHFSLLGFCVSTIGTFSGGMGPVANPFYLNSGVSKEAMTATKAMNSFIMGFTQVAAYTKFGLLTGHLWAYGIALGLGATLGNIIGKRLLKKMTDQSFKRLVYFVMLISGVLLLIKLSI